MGSIYFGLLLFVFVHFLINILKIARRAYAWGYSITFANESIGNELVVDEKKERSVAKP
jgi:hypothetical protein